MLQELGRETYVRALTEHRRLLRDAFTSHGGVEVEMQGDSFHFAFPYARDAVTAAVAGQRALHEHTWESQPIRVRIGLHTGEPMRADGLYAGIDVHRAARVMGCGHGGQIVLSDRTADLVGDELPQGTWLRDLGEYHLKDFARQQRLRQLLVDGLPAEFPPLRTLRSERTNLPVPASRFIGREPELLELGELVLRPDVRLVTLTGPGGTGKTRLAIEGADRLSDHFPDGVHFVDLAAVQDPSTVLAAVAQTLAVGEEPSTPLSDTLAFYLRHRSLLLVLDNFEQVIAAATDLARLLAASERLKLLITSRSRLRIAAEREFPVPPLQVPEPNEVDISKVMTSEAVKLFVARAEAIDPQFRVDRSATMALAEICFRLDGLPLAIELAAARISVLSPAAIASRLDDRLKLLVGGVRDAAERHRTLEATIAWSYDLLNDDEKAVFARLSIFAGGCRLEAAAVVSVPGRDARTETFDALASLVEKNLLRRRDDPDGEPRFWMLETIAVYAADQLAKDADAGEVARRHAAHYLAMAEEAEPALQNVDQDWLGRLANEHGNLIGSLRWLIERDPEAALRLGGSLHNYWRYQDRLTEGREWLERALAATTTRSLARAKALHALALIVELQEDFESAEKLLADCCTLCREQDFDDVLGRTLSICSFDAYAKDEYKRAEELAMEALAVSRKTDDSYGIANALGALGLASSRLGEPNRAERYLTESLDFARERGHINIVVWRHFDLGNLAARVGDTQRAEQLLEEGLELARKIGESSVVSAFLSQLGEVTLKRGDLLRARRLAEEALLLARDRGIRHETQSALKALAGIELAEGATGRAESLFSQALLVAHDLSDRLWSAVLLEWLALTAALDGNFERAAKLLGAADALREEIRTTPSPADVERLERLDTRLRHELGVVPRHVVDGVKRH